MPDIEQRVSGQGNIFSATGDVQVNIVQNVSSAEMEDRRGLTTLIEKVKRFWIQGVLENSVYNATVIELGMKSLPETVEHPWAAVLELPDQTSRTIRATQSVVSLFEDAGRALLILGEPGSGKTCTLLALAKGLITAAEADVASSHPVPVIFNLATWSWQRQSLFDWLVAELTARYQIPSKLGAHWLGEQRIVILLDGLDEVAQKHRTECVEAINAFVQKNGVPGIVVCSRLSEYVALGARLRLNAAICLQPLSMPQVYAYLEKAGAQLTALKALIDEDRDLQTLAQSPLMLNMMILSYQNATIDELRQTRIRTLEECRRDLIDSYIERMFKRKGKTAQPYAQPQVMKWLAWLAEKMLQYSRNVFQIEDIQPSWLPTRWQRLIYSLVSRVVIFFLLVLLIGCGVYSYGFLGAPLTAETARLALGAICGLSLVFGSVLGLIDLFILRRFGAQKERPEVPRHFSFSPITPILMHAIFFGLTVLMIFAPLIFSVTVNVYFPTSQVQSAADKIVRDMQLSNSGVSPGESRPGKANEGAEKVPSRGTSPASGGNKMDISLLKAIISNKLLQLFSVLALGIMMGFIYDLRMQRRGLGNDVQVSEALGWSFEGAWKGALLGVLLGILAVYISTQRFYTEINIYFPDNMGGGAIKQAEPRGLPESSKAFLSVSAIAFLFGMLAGGIKRKAIPIKSGPNQGIILTLRNAGMIGLMLGLMCALVTVWMRGVLQGLLVGFFAALLAALCNGGIDVLQHYLLRAILAVKRYAPFNYPSLLEHTTRLIFTQKVGAGYIFIHRYLLEHFAATNSPNALEKAGGS